MRQTWTLLVVLSGTFLAIMDSFIVNVAVPSLRAGLGATFAQAELAVSGYVLVYGLLLVTGGRLGDLYGTRRLFLAGTWVFLLGSLGAGLAPGPVALIAARAVQAAGAALFYPQVLAVLQTVFAGRARAFAAFGATIGLASIAGNAGLFFVLTLHLQDGLGYSPLTAGLAFVPLAAAFTAASLLGARLQARLGRHTLTLGYGINAAGTLALLATVWAADRATGWAMLPSLAVIGFGQGLGVSPLFGTVLNGVPDEHAGAAGGVLETAAQLGMSLGVTVLGLIFAAGRAAFGAALLGNLGLAVAALLLLPLLYGRRQPMPAM